MIAGDDKTEPQELKPEAPDEQADTEPAPPPVPAVEEQESKPAPVVGAFSVHLRKHGNW